MAGCSLLIGDDVGARDVNGKFLSLSHYVFLDDTLFAQRALVDLLHLKNLRFFCVDNVAAAAKALSSRMFT